MTDFCLPGLRGGRGVQTQLGVLGHSWAGSRLPIQQLQPPGSLHPGCPAVGQEQRREVCRNATCPGWGELENFPAVPRQMEPG